MARARNIKPGFYKNEDLAECSVWARLIYPGLWMLADRDGRLEDRPKRIKGELLPFDAVDVEPLLRELDARKFIHRYESDSVRYIQILKFGKHQTPHYTEKKSLIPPPSLPEYLAMMANKLQETGEDISDQDSGSQQVIKRGPLPPDSLNPDSLNHEPLQTPPLPPSADAEGGGPGETKPAKGRRRTVNPETSLPSPEWEPSDEAKSWTAGELTKHGLTDEWAWTQLDAMRDYAKQHPLWKHADWDATWRNWVRKAIDRLPRARAA